jgi:zinc transporter ZupT
MLPSGLFLFAILGFLLGAWPLFAARKGREPLVDFLYPAALALFLGYLLVVLLPHALLESWEMGVGFGAGIGVMAWLTRKVWKRDPCCESGHDHHPFGWSTFAALGFCSINDGLLIGLLQPEWGSGLFLGMVLHKLTSSFALAHSLARWGFGRPSWIALGVIHALISPVAYALGAEYRVSEIPGLSLAMAFSSGLLIYAVAAGMWPHSRQLLKKNPWAWIGFAGALGLSLALSVGHESLHDHSSDENDSHPAHEP